MKNNTRIGADYTELIKTLPKKFKPVASYIKLHEAEGSLAHIRFAQDTIVNWVPKAIMSRSLTDFADMSFLEHAENLLVYYGGKLLGEGLFRKPYAKKLGEKLEQKVPIRAEKILSDNKISADDKKKLMPVKAAIAISALAIPLAEYSLNYIKNIMTLKFFKQADFNNIANLNKDKREDIAKQKQVRESSKKHIMLAAGLFIGCLGSSALLLRKGRDSKFLQSISETILAPGNKIFKPKSNDKKAIAKAAEKAKTFNKYFSIDFDSVDVKDKFGNLVKDKFGNTKKKLALSTGQLMACVLIGFAGYMGAAKDRGKQNMLEVLFRYPIVTFYVITGADLFIAGFKKLLGKTGKCKELLEAEAANKKINEQKIATGDENLIEHEMPRLKDLPKLAEKLAAKKGIKNEVEFKKAVEAEFEKLFKQKATIIGVPTLFSLIVMGFFVAGYSRLFTQYRYNKEKAKETNIQHK